MKSDFLKPVFGAFLLLVGLLLTFMGAPMEYEKAWVPHVLFALGWITTGIGVWAMLKFSWPMLENIGRLAVFFIAYLIFLVYLTELGTVLETWGKYSYMTVPAGEDIPITTTVIILLTLAGMYLLTLGQKYITRINI